MPDPTKLEEVALAVDKLLMQAGNMEAVKRLAEDCLADPEKGHIDAIQFPTDPDDPFDWTLESIERERGHREYPVLTPGQIALTLAALHAAYCHGVETVITIPDPEPRIDGNEMAASDFPRVVRWIVIRDRVRRLGEHALMWFTLLLRRFENLLHSAHSPRSEVQENQPQVEPKGVHVADDRSGEGCPDEPMLVFSRR